MCTKKLICLSLLLLLLGTSSCSHKSFAASFQKYAVNGTMILESLDKRDRYVYNIERSKKRFLPGSTFKIVNTLIALNESAVKNENELIKWDGTKYAYEKWNQDHNIASAFAVSCVWFYEELARRVGKEKYEFYLKAMKYGNMNASGSFPFWLEGELAISAQEQIEIMRNIYEERYRFSPESYRILKGIMLLEKSGSFSLFGKTGWVTKSSPQLGWFVGFVETGDGVYLFALNIDIDLPADGAKRVMIVKDALHEAGILE